MLSEKYAEDFLEVIEMCDLSGQLRLGNGRILKTTNQKISKEIIEGVFMWPHVYVDVTEDMECFHEEFLDQP